MITIQMKDKPRANQNQLLSGTASLVGLFAKLSGKLGKPCAQIILCSMDHQLMFWNFVGSYRGGYSKPYQTPKPPG